MQVLQEHQVSGQRLAQESLQGKLTCPVWLQGQLRLLPEDKELARLLLCTEVLRGSEAQVVQVLQEHQLSGQRLAQESLLQGKLTCSGVAAGAAMFAAGRLGAGTVVVVHGGSAGGQRHRWCRYRSTRCLGSGWHRSRCCKGS